GGSKSESFVGSPNCRSLANSFCTSMKGARALCPNQVSNKVVKMKATATQTHFRIAKSPQTGLGFGCEAHSIYSLCIRSLWLSAFAVTSPRNAPKNCSPNCTRNCAQDCEHDSVSERDCSSAPFGITSSHAMTGVQFKPVRKTKPLAPQSLLSQEFVCPLSIFTLQRYWRVAAIIYSAGIGTFIVAAVKHSLQIQNDIGVAFGERNEDAGQALPYRDRPNLKAIPLPATMQTDKIIPLAPFKQLFPRHGSGVFASSQKVYLNEMRLAFENLLLLGQVKFSPIMPRSFVGVTEDLNDCHHTALFPNEQDFHEHLPYFHWLICQHQRWITCYRGRYASCTLLWLSLGKRTLQHDHIGVNASFWLNNVNSLANVSNIARRQRCIQRCSYVSDQPLMHSRPKDRIFKVWIHPRKGTGHWNHLPLFGINSNALGVCPVTPLHFAAHHKLTSPLNSQ
ncbi:MAG: hypothetical protein GDYSWBUE_000438, partial [Candidatus Fervidibacterota bacterium]